MLARGRRFRNIAALACALTAGAWLGTALLEPDDRGSNGVAAGHARSRIDPPAHSPAGSRPLATPTDDAPVETPAAPRSQEAPASHHAAPLPRWLDEALGETGGERDGRVTTNRHATGSEPFDPRDLAALQDLIDANGLSESASPFDFDDQDGVFEPWELGFQAWQDGRLVALSFGPDPFSSFGYPVERLPASLGALTELRALDAHGLDLAALPPEIGELRSLRELRIYRNRLSELPPSIGDLASLETLALHENDIAWLPESMEALARLQNFYLGENPIDALPLWLAELPIARLDVRNLAQTPGSTSNLEMILERIPIEELHATAREARGVRPELLERVPRVYGIPPSSAHYAGYSPADSSD